MAAIKPKTYSNIDTGFMPEKIMATAMYHLKTLENIHIGKSKRQIAMAGATIVDKYFGLWLDNKARRDPQRYHHVYEWDKTGDKNARLFDCEITYHGDPIIRFNLKQSKEANKDGYVFSQKAFAMEYGDPVVIEPVDAEVLAFEIDEEVVFHPGPITIQNPGGEEVQGSFYSAVRDYMYGEAGAALEAMNFGGAILRSVDNESNRVLSRMSGHTVINPYAEANETAQRVVNTVEVISNDV